MSEPITVAQDCLHFPWHPSVTVSAFSQEDSYRTYPLEGDDCIIVASHDD
jgi:hypothetical protein